MSDTSSKLLEFYQADGPERCGLITAGGILETKNIAEDPTTAFEVPPDELLKYESELVGTWHTHPGISANLSHADYDGFRAWPELDHFIIGSDGVRLYRVDDRGLIFQVED